MPLTDLHRAIKQWLRRIPFLGRLRARMVTSVDEEQERRLTAWRSRGLPSYDENNLVTWEQSVDFMSDARFLSAYRRGMDSGHQIMRPAGSREDIQIKWRV